MTTEDMGMDGKLVGALSVVDFGLGLPAALVVRVLADMGARVQRFEPAAGDPFYEFYPAYAFWRPISWTAVTALGLVASPQAPPNLVP